VATSAASATLPSDNTGLSVIKVSIKFVKATLPANQNLAGSGSKGSGSNPSIDTSSFPPNLCAGGKLHGQSSAVK
jgi:hypothetical protein